MDVYAILIAQKRKLTLADKEQIEALAWLPIQAAKRSAGAQGSPGAGQTHATSPSDCSVTEPGGDIADNAGTRAADSPARHSVQVGSQAEIAVVHSHFQSSSCGRVQDIENATSNSTQADTRVSNAKAERTAARETGAQAENDFRAAMTSYLADSRPQPDLTQMQVRSLAKRAGLSQLSLRQSCAGCSRLRAPRKSAHCSGHSGVQCCQGRKGAGRVQSATFQCQSWRQETQKQLGGLPRCHLQCFAAMALSGFARHSTSLQASVFQSQAPAFTAADWVWTKGSCMCTGCGCPLSKAVQASSRSLLACTAFKATTAASQAMLMSSCNTPITYCWHLCSQAVLPRLH